MIPEHCRRPRPITTTSQVSVAIRSLRKAATNRAIGGFLALSNALPPLAFQPLGRSVGVTAALALHHQLRTNMRQALGHGDVPPGAVDRYFQLLGEWAGWSGRIYRQGLCRSGAEDRITPDASIASLEEALAGGRGVVLCVPHTFLFHVGLGYIAARYKLTSIARESKSRMKRDIKRRWYAALGLQTIMRSGKASEAAVSLNSLRVLRKGAILAIAPDVMVQRGGVPIWLFGRRVSVMPGMVGLAMHARAPLVTCYLNWQPDGRGELRFSRPTYFGGEQQGNKPSDAVSVTVQEHVQTWYQEFELYLRQHSENWMFWLHKRWSDAIREQS